MWRHIAANALTLLVVGLFLLGGLVAWGIAQWREPGPLAQAICLQVPGGTNMRAVSQDLADQGAITSPEILRIGADYAGKASLLKEGSFLIPERASMSEIVDIMTRGGANTCGTQVVFQVGVNRTMARVRDLDPASGEFDEVAAFDLAAGPVPPEYETVLAEPDTTWRVVVAEGVTSWQVVQALNAIEVLEGDAEEIPAEGTLAPRDYALEPGTAVQAVLDEMAAAQSAILAEEWEARSGDLPFDTPEEALTLASIIEKETAVAGERPIVSSVLVNRLRRGDMRLQFDPTIIYGITRGQGVLDRPIRESDIEGRTERELHGEVLYNTYVIDGLPAGPIANPGRASIEAALNPADTEYLFFVADGTGGHAFAVTDEEHEQNVVRWREIEAERAAAGEEMPEEAGEGTGTGTAEPAATP